MDCDRNRGRSSYGGNRGRGRLRGLHPESIMLSRDGIYRQIKSEGLALKAGSS